MLYLSQMDGSRESHGFGQPQWKACDRDFKAKGDVVTGLTGEVISVPIPAKADRDVPETPIKKGDTFYVLHYNRGGLLESVVGWQNHFCA